MRRAAIEARRPQPPPQRSKLTVTKHLKGHATNSHGSLQIYVHSKVLIVDDLFASIGSANTNRRSFELDTEPNVGWFDPRGVAAFRRKLWAELLGNPRDLSRWTPKGFIEGWNKIANRNTTSRPDARTGFVIPHDVEKWKGKWDPEKPIPPEFAELTDVERSPDTALA